MPESHTSIAAFVLRYVPTPEVSAVADLVQKALKTLMPGCKVAREVANSGHFQLVRVEDGRIVTDLTADAVAQLMQKDNLKELLDVARRW